MPKDRDDQLNTSPGPEGGYSLEEILAEFGGGSASRREGPADEVTAVPEVPRREKKPSAPPGGAKPPEPAGAGERPPAPPEGKVLHFPTAQARPDGARSQPAARREDPPFRGGGRARETPPEPRPPEEGPQQPQPRLPEEGTKVLPFRGETQEPEGEDETFFTQKLSALRKKADEYAQHMFENAGVEADPEVRRAEKYIPGVDVEEPPPQDRPRPARRLRPPRRAPDLSAEELAARYGKGLRLLRLRSILVLLLAVPMLYLSIFQYIGAPLPGELAGSYSLQVYTMAGMLGAAMALGIDQLVLPLARAFRLQMGLDTLCSLACIVTLTEALTLSPAGRGGQLPYCGVCALSLGLTMRGAYLKARGQRQASRTAASAREPYYVTLDEGKWNSRAAYVKWSGQCPGFGSQLQASDGAQRIFRVAAPLLLIGCVAFSLMASAGRGRPELLLWCLSTQLTAAATFSGGLCFAVPWNRLCARLGTCGAALAGWDAVTGVGGAGAIVLTDSDLFPPGSVAFNGIKVFGNFPVEKVVGYTASLIRDSGSGLSKLFHDQLRAQGAIYRRCEEFRHHEGGVSATVRGERVLVGSAAFMHLMHIALPQGLNVKNAVFCAIDGDLAGIFALNYSLHSAVRPSLAALIQSRVGPVLATRDFNLTPAMLRQRFKLPVEKMEYPAVERRVELSEGEQEHSEVLTAVLCREGLFPFSEAVVGAVRLRFAVRLSAAVAVLGAAVGAVLGFYLTFVEAYASLSSANLLVFLLMWTVPTLLISGWVDRY